MGLPAGLPALLLAVSPMMRKLLFRMKSRAEGTAPT
jgi:hypothetical protein